METCLKVCITPLRKGRYARFVSGLRWGVRDVALECGSHAPALGGRSRASPPAWQQAAKAPAWLAHSKSVCPPCMPLGTTLIVNLSATEPLYIGGCAIARFGSLGEECARCQGFEKEEELRNRERKHTMMTDSGETELYTQRVISHHFCGADIRKQPCFGATHRDSEKE